MLIIKENLFWAFFYNILLIPVAAGVLSEIGITVSPMLGALCMSLSSFCVVSNALRLNFVRDDLMPEKASGKQTILLHIEGMMCHHCERTVEKYALEIPDVIKAKANYKKGTLKILVKGTLNTAALKEKLARDEYILLE